MKKSNWAILILILFLVNLVPLGCYDYQEVDETAYILVLGIDKGRENKVTLTARIAVPRRVGTGTSGTSGGDGGGGGDSKPTEIISVESPTVISAFNMMNTFLSRRMSLKHVKAVVFSEEIAREGIMPYLSVMGRFPEFRRNIFIAIVRGSPAKELVEQSKPVLESNPAKYVEMATLSARYTALTPLRPQFNYFYNSTLSMGGDPSGILLGLLRKTPQGEGPAIEQPYGWRSEGSYLAGEEPRSGGNSVELMGTALFKGDRMVGEATGDEVTALMMLRDTFSQAFFTVQDPLSPEYMVSISLRQRIPPHYKIDVSEPVPRISIEVSLEGGAMGIQSRQNYEDPRYRPILEAAAAERVQGDIVKVLKRTQDLGVDPAWIGERAKLHFLTEKDWVDYGWKTVYPQAQIELNVKVDLRTFGLMRESAQVAR